GKFGPCHLKAIANRSWSYLKLQLRLPPTDICHPMSAGSRTLRMNPEQVKSMSRLSAEGKGDGKSLPTEEHSPSGAKMASNFISWTSPSTCTQYRSAKSGMRCNSGRLTVLSAPAAIPPRKFSTTCLQMERKFLSTGFHNRLGKR